METQQRPPLRMTMKVMPKEEAQKRYGDMTGRRASSRFKDLLERIDYELGKLNTSNGSSETIVFELERLPDPKETFRELDSARMAIYSWIMHRKLPFIVRNRRRDNVILIVHDPSIVAVYEERLKNEGRGR